MTKSRILQKRQRTSHIARKGKDSDDTPERNSNDSLYAFTCVVQVAQHVVIQTESLLGHFVVNPENT